MTMVALRPLPSGIIKGQALTALAPMQDVTNLPFMRVVSHYGAPDYFFTEFLRVHAHSTPERHIVQTLEQNDTGRPIFAQLIGESLEHLERTTRLLLSLPIAGIDLNLGCPAPKVYKKNVGGGLLRDPAHIGEILRCLRACVPGPLSVKMRLGFEDTANFHRILDLVNEHQVDLLSVHGRLVKQMYRGGVDYGLIAEAVSRVNCPVLANGEISSAAKAVEVLKRTGAAGVMIGRHAIRNPWIFEQIREVLAGGQARVITLADVYDYIHRLYETLGESSIPELLQVARMKKFLNFVGQGVDPEGAFLRDMRGAVSRAALFEVCARHLLDQPTACFAAEPYPGVVARPNCEDSCLGT